MENYKDELKQALNAIYGANAEANEETEVATDVSDAQDTTRFALGYMSKALDNRPDYAIRLAVTLGNVSFELYMDEDNYRQFKKCWNDRARDFITIKCHKDRWSELRSITLRKSAINSIFWPVPKPKEVRE